MHLRHGRWTREAKKQWMCSIIGAYEKSLVIRMQDCVSTKELLERSGIKRLSEKVKSCRWKMIVHILRKDPNDDCKVTMSWAPEGKRRRGRPKTTWKRTVEKEKEEAGWSSWGSADSSNWSARVKKLCKGPCVPQGTDYINNMYSIFCKLSEMLLSPNAFGYTYFASIPDVVHCLNYLHTTAMFTCLDDKK